MGKIKRKPKTITEKAVTHLRGNKMQLLKAYRASLADEAARLEEVCSEDNKKVFTLLENIRKNRYGKEKREESYREANKHDSDCLDYMLDIFSVTHEIIDIDAEIEIEILKQKELDTPNVEAKD